MEIENNNLSSATAQAATQATPQRTEAEKVPAEAANSAPATDSVSLTPAAQQLQGLQAQIEEQPVVDSQRVDAVRNAINDGTFEVNPQRIADQLVSIEQALTDAS